MTYLRRNIHNSRLFAKAFHSLGPGSTRSAVQGKVASDYPLRRCLRGIIMVMFGSEALSSVVEPWTSQFYPGGAETRAEFYGEEAKGSAEARLATSKEQATSRNERHTDRDRRGMHIDFLMLPYMLIPPEKVRTAMEKREAQREKRDRRAFKLQARVNGWLEDL